MNPTKLNINWRKLEKIQVEDILFKNLGRMYYENIRHNSEETKKQIEEIILNLNILKTYG